MAELKLFLLCLWSFGAVKLERKLPDKAAQGETSLISGPSPPQRRQLHAGLEACITAANTEVLAFASEVRSKPSLDPNSRHT